MYCWEELNLSFPGPQPGVLPLNYSSVLVAGPGNDPG
jgi:hypothetical protein